MGPIQNAFFSIMMPSISVCDKPVIEIVNTAHSAASNFFIVIILRRQGEIFYNYLQKIFPAIF